MRGEKAYSGRLATFDGASSGRGFSTMRGYGFRGASPIENGVRVGGGFRWLNSVEYFFPLTADGTFTASVVARNSAGKSGAATSGSISFTANPGSVPGTPRNVTSATFRTGTAGQTGFVVAWDAPNTGDPPTSYTVTISGGPTALHPRMTCLL